MTITALYISVSLDDSDIRKITQTADKIVAKHGGVFQGGGTGFGRRDIDFEFDGEVPQPCLEALQDAFPGCDLYVYDITRERSMYAVADYLADLMTKIIDNDAEAEFYDELLQTIDRYARAL